ncbi:MAG: hypothetical protein AAF533_29895 [Acidobacteriota bacterium]
MSSLRFKHYLLLLLVLNVASAQAGDVFSGIIVDGVEADGSCMPTGATEIELLAVKVGSLGLDTTDWHYVKDGSSVGGASQSGFTYSIVPGNFSVPEAGTDRTWFFLSTPSPDAGGDWLAVDSSDPSALELGATTYQRVGDTIAASFAEHSGTGIHFDGSGLPVRIYLGVVSTSFPTWTTESIDVLFGALIDYQPTLYLPSAGCGFGGAVEHQLHPGRGLVIGYNIYRREDVGGPAPAKESWGLEDWLSFIPAVDEPGDLSGTIDINDVIQDGNEYLIFSDSDLPSLRQSPQPPPEPRCGQVYWYVIQPVIEGDYEQWSDETLIAGVPLGFEPKLPDGGIDMTGDGEPEFFSPQAIHAGRSGLGLTVDGRPLLSAAVRSCTASSPLAASGQVELRTGSGQTLELVLGFATADVLGYDVYRLDRGRRHRVNARLLPAQGAEGGVVLLEGPRLRGGRQGTYEVEVVLTDGGVRVEGPFTLVAADTRRSRRR